ncbi:hypothetical protein AU152_gp70 [Mycobacterium phage Phlei]|uniref:Uncharacterized protein n=1 Tax=Mycobacterium phage Phlei TaxID=1690684 RepID=A0A0N9BDS3_9CAUD|nr:hypothetical protein AU152_gp70 [Mycobacterium phage Phlei]ALA48183.1 hypothetical protein [Mycobacterium phage Phlei]
MKFEVNDHGEFDYTDGFGDRMVVRKFSNGQVLIGGTNGIAGIEIVLHQEAVAALMEYLKREVGIAE